jgi:hypothetical protein
MEEGAMKTSIGAAIAIAGLALGALALTSPAAMGSTAWSVSRGKGQAASSQTAVLAVTTDFSARRRYRQHTRYAYRPVAPPSYYDRPNYYRPYPYAAPVPFFLGLGFGP